ncbi:hypothetical protein I79_024502 [Cricetulus griseus]|uniref:Uncharacterized protein n=1 Tax=Cricetulus griseus TaxID=10029 RepID=G3IKU8_CRIGR|nr:hypothetical protein I79_024502 [Cricetulus griseus]
MMQNSDSINARKYNRNCVQLGHQEWQQALPRKRLRTAMGRGAGKGLRLRPGPSCCWCRKPLEQC